MDQSSQAAQERRFLNLESVRNSQGRSLAWQNKAKRDRGAKWKSTEPPANKCSGTDWEPTDEGMDVAGEIADVDSQIGRTEAGVTLWQAYCYGSLEAVGILIMQHAVSDDEDHQLGIRWLVGHPTTKGAGSALMAKADELHRKPEYRKSPLHVTASASSVKWYASKGFEHKRLASCHDEVTPCGCVIMQKPPPG